MQNETNERLTAIEMKLAYMEDFVNQIQNVTVEQAKTIDKLQQLNPFQERSEDGGVWWHDFIHGDPTAGIVGTHALPTYNINSDQKNNITINTNESAKAVKKTIERYSKDLIPSYVPMMN